jgi:adenylylsulfate kinase
MSSALAQTVYGPNLSIDQALRRQRLQQTPKVVWFTGLSGSGKSTLANAVEVALWEQGHATYMLDGDHLRQGLCRDLGFSVADRAENIRRVGEVARLMVDAGLIVLASFISPSRQERDAVRARFAPGAFVEVFVATPLAVCEQRDPKGLYRLARSGRLCPLRSPRTGRGGDRHQPTALGRWGGPSAQAGAPAAGLRAGA